MVKSHHRSGKESGASNKHRLQSSTLGTDDLAALAPTAPENKAASFSGHPLAEAVPVSPFHIARLKCPFHGTLLLIILFQREMLMKQDHLVKKNSQLSTHQHRNFCIHWLPKISRLSGSVFSMGPWDFLDFNKQTS